MANTARNVSARSAHDSQLIELVDVYASLEMRVNRLMRAACSSVCAVCRRVCCRPEMCRETLESPFLALVREHGQNKLAWDEELGWLGPKGCKLKMGRPPVCYEFICPAIINALPDQATQTRVKDLAMLLSKAGRRAIGGDHLVEIMTTERLAKVNHRRMAARFGSAQAKLAEQESFWGCREAP